MTTRYSGFCSLELLSELPRNICIPKEAMQSVRKLKRSIISISAKREGDEYLKSILNTIEATEKTNCKVTKITQDGNTLKLHVRFNSHREIENFRVYASGKVVGIGFKFITKFEPNLSTPPNSNLYNMKEFLKLCDFKFYSAIAPNNGVITKCYQNSNCTIQTWVCFGKLKHAKNFLLSVSKNTD